MSEIRGHHELSPVERMQAGLAAELFRWLQDADAGARSQAILSDLFSALGLPLSDLLELAPRPEVALTMLCEVDAAVRAGLSRAFRDAPFYLELATCEGHIARSARFHHAAWLFLNPRAARIVLLRYQAQIPFQPPAITRFLARLDAAIRDQDEPFVLVSQVA